MIVSVIYPNHDGARFDGDYYRDSHAPAAVEAWQPESVTLIEGVTTAESGMPPFALIAHFHFASQEAMSRALADPRSAHLTADVANFTDITPVMMIGQPL